MPVITLLTDLGLQDASVASVKGILMQQTPGYDIIDISHFVEPFHLPQAAYLLAASWNNFPKDTCHVVICDVFAKKPPVLVLAKYEGHYFLAPDNGILPLTFDKKMEAVWKCLELSAPLTIKDWVAAAGKAINDIQQNAAKPEAYELKHDAAQWQPKTEENTVECHVIHIDRFENVVLNITKEQFDAIGKGRSFTIRLLGNDEITSMSEYYNDVREGYLLCRFNTAGYLELCMNRGNAASLIGLKLHKEQHLIYNTIKITFQ
jgi:S-adenosylmethionine hydrolase